MIAFIDESGDLGFKFSAPFLHGGSSRFLTLAYVIVPKAIEPRLNRIIKFHYDKKKLNPSIEKKGANVTSDDAKKIAEQIVKLINKNPDIRIGTVTVKKENVPAKMREGNLVYNYSLVKAFAPQVKDYSEITVIPDKRSVRVVDGDTLDNYLKIKLYAEIGSTINVIYEPRESTHEKSLWFIDWIANFIWRHYEKGDSQAYDILNNSGLLIEDHLYF